MQTGKVTVFNFELRTKFSERNNYRIPFVFFIFSEWCAERKINPALEEMSTQQLDQNLTMFYAEARRQDGQP